MKRLHSLGHLSMAIALGGCQPRDAADGDAPTRTEAPPWHAEVAKAASPDGVATRDVGPTIGQATPVAPTFHIFLLLGQSNMAGYPKALASDKVRNPRVRVLGYDNCAATGRQQNKWDVATPPLHECWNGAIGPGDYFAKAMLDELPEGDTIGLVPCAISGEKIETFLKRGGAKYGWILERARLARQAGGVIEGMLFHQGESNCGDPAWPEKVRALVQDLRTDLSLASIPFVAGELVPTGACARHNALVNKLPQLMSQTFVVSASGLGLDPSDTTWRLHFDHTSQITLGMRYQSTMMEALGWPKRR